MVGGDFVLQLNILNFVLEFCICLSVGQEFQFICNWETVLLIIDCSDFESLPG